MSNNPLSFTPPFILGSISPLIFSKLSPTALPSNEEQGCSQFIIYCLCCSFLLERMILWIPLLLQCGISPTGSNSSWVSKTGPSNRLQFFSNCFTMDLFHGTQSFGNRLLRSGSYTGSQVLPADLLKCGLLCPQGSPVKTLRGQDLLWASTCTSIVFTMGFREISALAPVAPSPLPSSLTSLSAELFLSHTLIPLFGCCCIAGFSPS